MAEGKKSFIAYCDWIEIFESLPDDKAGQLVKHLFKYVNDLGPENDDILIKTAFISIKQTLKRDLKKWEQISDIRSKAGKKGGRPKKQTKAKKAKGFSEKQTKAKKADSVSVSVSVNDSVSDSEEKNIFNFKKSLIDLGVDSQVASDWLKVRSKKKAANTETAFKKIKSEIDKSGKDANFCIKIAVERSWQGFQSDWIKNINNSSQQLAG